MVDFNIGKNQGITQAIRDKIGASNIKNTDLKTWQSVVSLVDSAKQNDSIFKKHGSDGTTFTTDKTKIDDKSSYQTNYVVDESKVTIDDGIWDKITKLLTGSDFENTSLKAELDCKGNAEEAKAGIEKTLHANPAQNSVNLDAKANLNIDTSNISVPVMATGKQLTRSVNGTPQNIEILNINGQKVRFAVNDDGTRGEQLVTVSTAGKNKYVTQSEFNKTVKSMLELGENDVIPKDLKPEYVSIGGEPKLVFKKDGKVMDGSQLRQFMTDYNNSKAPKTIDKDSQVQYNSKTKQFTLGKNLQDSLNNINKQSSLSGQLEFGASGSTVKYNGTQYTIAMDVNGTKLLKDASENYFQYDASGNKLDPVNNPQIHGVNWEKGEYSGFNFD